MIDYEFYLEFFDEGEPSVFTSIWFWMLWLIPGLIAGLVMAIRNKSGRNPGQDDVIVLLSECVMGALLGWITVFRALRKARD